ncbi:MAG: hypothetical protein MI744_11905 [Pseudomonadales bacterium]|nr:hypothetical protein [Pseudomonadales bacterium]
MSHFILSVFTESRPSEEFLSRLLSPFEETDCSDQPKWDWWVVGGRWLGELIVKPGVTDFITGQPGAFDNEAQLGGVDGARIADLDLAVMLDRARDDRAAHWDQAHAQQQDGAKPHPWTVDTSAVPRSEYVDLATPFTPFAYLLDGEWFEKGEMGWWGVARDEQPEADWNPRPDQPVLVAALQNRLRSTSRFSLCRHHPAAPGTRRNRTDQTCSQVFASSLILY